ncbi:hypothetical protein WKK05_20245 [Nostoc sp. UHCC 0302]|uniref:hypothetical protein n=1 Tax=Nostoc sp. UHCC 0302 TaxID=3134896 RepID=UPI00311CB129
MKPSYLPITWPKTSKQSALKKKLIGKQEILLLQVLALIKKRSLSWNSTAFFQYCLINSCRNKLFNQRLLLLKTQAIDELEFDTSSSEMC